MIPSITAWRKRRSPGEDGFYLISSEPFDLIVLDVMLPGRSGLKIPSTARFRGLRTPVLILTARDSVEDRAIGLDSGADDYLVHSRFPSCNHAFACCSGEERKNR